jgi:hypothetical protein
MESNLHKLDRVLRIIVAALIGYMSFIGMFEGQLALILPIVAIVFALTGIINFCPLYKLMGISTRK